MRVGSRVRLDWPIYRGPGAPEIPVGSVGTISAIKVVGSEYGDLPLARIAWDGIGLDNWRSVLPFSVVQPLTDTP